MQDPSLGIKVFILLAAVTGSGLNVRPNSDETQSSKNYCGKVISFIRETNANQVLHNPNFLVTIGESLPWCEANKGER